MRGMSRWPSRTIHQEGECYVKKKKEKVTPTLEWQHTDKKMKKELSSEIAITKISPGSLGHPLH